MVIIGANPNEGQKVAIPTETMISDSKVKGIYGKNLRNGMSMLNK